MKEIFNEVAIGMGFDTHGKSLLLRPDAVSLPLLNRKE
jgi:hypothetical protein